MLIGEMFGSRARSYLHWRTRTYPIALVIRLVITWINLCTQRAYTVCYIGKKINQQETKGRNALLRNFLLSWLCQVAQLHLSCGCFNFNMIFLAWRKKAKREKWNLSNDMLSLPEFIFLNCVWKLSGITALWYVFLQVQFYTRILFPGDSCSSAVYDGVSLAVLLAQPKEVCKIVCVMMASPCQELESKLIKSIVLVFGNLGSFCWNNKTFESYQSR